MTTKHTRVPSLCRHKASGRAVVQLDGKDYYCGRHGSETAQAEYDRLISIYLANSRRMPREATGQADITIVELIAQYWEHAQQHYRKPDGRPTSELSCIKIVLRPLRAMFGRELAQDFGPLKLKAVRQEMIDRRLSRKSINLHVGRIRRVFKWGVENELVRPDVLQALLAVRGLQRGRSEAKETEPIQPVPEQHVDAVLPYLSPQVDAMVQLMTLTGMRVGEVTIMRTADIDRSGTECWLYKPREHKTQHHGHERLIPLGPQAQEVLKGFLKADPDAFLFTPKEAMEHFNAKRRAERRTPMTPSQLHRQERARAKPKRKYLPHFDRNAVRQAIVRACKAADVPPFHPHQLRHTAATRLRREFGIEAARVILGHSSSLVTEVYAEIDRAKALEIMSQVG